MLRKKDMIKISAATSAAVLTLALGITVLPRAFAEPGDPEPGGSETLLPEQSISYDVIDLTKTYGDVAFINPLSGTPAGAVIYESSDTDVATIDAETGEVTIVASGTTVITATAAATSEYAETVASYNLTVNKKEVSILDATVANKTYDGTTGAIISAITLSESTLVPGVDFTAEALFGDGNVGDDITVLVSVDFVGDAADKYYMSDEEYITSADITPFEIQDADVSIYPEEFIYSGNTNTPMVTVMVQLDGEHETVLVEGEDYDVSYEVETIEAGHYDVTVIGKGNFIESSVDKTYLVAQYEITSANINLEYSTIRHDGEAKTPEVRVMIGDFEVDANEYDVTYADNTEIGTATVTVAAKTDQNIVGDAQVNFEITEKNELVISGIESGQEITYTGNPVVLIGDLTVGDNSDGITVDDLTTTWYDENGDEMGEQPVAAGSYTVVYSYDGENYAGSLTATFEITKAESPEPIEMTDGLVGIGGLGQTLADIEGQRTVGFEWANPDALVEAGEHRHIAYYTYNGDTTNYTTVVLEVPVYGLSVVDITADVDGAGGGIVHPDNALEGDDAEFIIEPADGYELDRILVNSVDLTDAVVDNRLVITVGADDIHVVVSFVEKGDASDDKNPSAPDTGFFTSANGGVRAAGAIAIGIMTAAGAAVVLRKRFAGSKIDFDKK